MLKSSASKVTVTSYGAIADDEKDDSFAINLALAVAKYADGPVTVAIPSGTYYIDAPLKIYSNTTIRGDSDTVLIGRGAGNPIVESAHIETDGSICTGQNSSCTIGGYKQIQDITIQSVTFDQDDVSGQTETKAIRLSHGENISILNCTFLRQSGNAILLTGCKECSITGCQFQNQVALSNSTAEREAILLDRADKAAKFHSYPLDGTHCQNISLNSSALTGQSSGIGCHTVRKKNLQTVENLIIKDTTFRKISGNCLNAYNCLGLTFNSSTGSTLENVGRVATLSATSEAHISGLTFECLTYASTISGTSSSSGTTYGSNGFVLKNGSSLTLSDTTIAGCTKSGICLYGESTLTLNGCSITHCGGHGIYINHSTLFTDALTIESPGKSGVYLENVTGSSLKNLTINNSGTNGIQVSNGQKITVSGLTIDSPKEDGILFKNTSGSILDCTILSPKKNGIEVAESKVVLSGNTVKTPGKVGISLLESDGSSILENTITKPSSYGISILESKSVKVRKNQVNNGQNIGIYAKGSKTHKTSVKASYNKLMSIFGYRNIYFDVYCTNCSATYNTIGAGGIGAGKKVTITKEYNSTLQTMTPPVLSVSAGNQSEDSGQESVLLSWIKRPYINLYKIYRSTDGVNFTRIATIKGSLTQYEDQTKFKAGQTYYYKIMAVAGSLTGESNVISVTR